MFRRLFAIETAALQASREENAPRQEASDYTPGEMLRDVSRFVGTPSRYGMWASRSTL
ncbi:hypothetical protein [Lichenicola sp.]|uniref:hypothetical protein n=1 Tax=Lichenicola sp. TaxID=2804529 RepID=UPI003AFF73E4